MIKSNFAVFILTNRRADNVITYKTLRRSGYTGEVYIVIDNLDTQREEYIDQYGDKVLIFDKKKVAEEFDEADNFDDMRTIFYARNASFKLAKNLGLDYFLELDDDYSQFSYRFNTDFEFKNKPIKRFDDLIELMIEFYDKANLLVLAMAQGGDYIGGSKGGMGKKVQVKRKAMNSLLCSTKKPFKFLGRLNEDVNTYVTLGSKGELLFTCNVTAINQNATQSNEGGMTEVYLDSGTYVKSFYSVMVQPSSVKIALMGNKSKRIHHKIYWENTVPKIIRE